MKKTLLLCFIHGFKGGESTFGDNYAFTEHLRQLVARELPRVDVRVLVYPRYETRGDLGECVARFRDWLLNKTIDIEVAAGTPSPTVDSSVRTILIGHSMGGIVAAETAIALTSETPIHGSTDPAKDDDADAAADEPRPPTPNSLMFPYVQGVLGLDTPYLGIAPGVVAHGAESRYNAASEVVTQLSGLTGFWGATAAGASSGDAARQQGKAAVAALPAPPETAGRSKDDGKTSTANSGSGVWGRWGTVAMVAGAVGAVAAGGAAAYLNRQQLGEGWGWATSHLEFVGCLARKEELRRRVARMVRLRADLGVGFGNLYTRLGRGAGSKTVSSAVGTVLGSQRTFCVVPQRDVAGDWREAINDKATDETLAHMTMFEPRENPGYERLAHDAKDMIRTWLQNEWYESSTGTIGR